MQCLVIFVQSIDKCRHWDILKVAVLNRSTKETMTGHFVEHTFHSLLAFYQISKNEMLKQIGIITNESYQ